MRNYYSYQNDTNKLDNNNNNMKIEILNPVDTLLIIYKFNDYTYSQIIEIIKQSEVYDCNEWNELLQQYNGDEYQTLLQWNNKHNFCYMQEGCITWKITYKNQVYYYNKHQHSQGSRYLYKNVQCNNPLIEMGRTKILLLDTDLELIPNIKGIKLKIDEYMKK